VEFDTRMHAHPHAHVRAHPHDCARMRARCCQDGQVTANAFINQVKTGSESG